MTTSIIPWRNPDTQKISTQTKNVAVPFAYDCTLPRLLKRHTINLWTELLCEGVMLKLLQICVYSTVRLPKLDFYKKQLLSFIKVWQEYWQNKSIVQCASVFLLSLMILFLLLVNHHRLMWPFLWIHCTFLNCVVLHYCYRSRITVIESKLSELSHKFMRPATWHDTWCKQTVLVFSWLTTLMQYGLTDCGSC